MLIDKLAFMTIYLAGASPTYAKYYSFVTFLSCLASYVGSETPATIYSVVFSRRLRCK